MKLTTLAACLGAAIAFSDTAAFFSTHPLPVDLLQYILKSADLTSAFKQYTSRFCLESPDERLTVYRVRRLSRNPPAMLDADATFIKHVHYLSGSDIDMAVGDECTVLYVDHLPNDMSKIDANVIVVDVEDTEKHSVEEFLSGAHVLVQGKPGFQTAGFHGESFKKFIGDKLNFDFGSHHKRDAMGSKNLELVDGSDLEYEPEFELAESLILAQESDDTVAAMDDVSAEKENRGLALKSNSSSTKSNLFTNYQFFTPGVWLVLIVCFFLLYVCITAVSWITSIDLSYKSFDKQIEYEKKNE